MTKIYQRIPSSEPYAYFEIEWEDVETFKKDYGKITDLVKSRLPQPDHEERPRCSICNNFMKPTKAGSRKKFYCKHGSKEEPIWGEPTYPEKELPEKQQTFITNLNS